MKMTRGGWLGARDGETENGVVFPEVVLIIGAEPSRHSSYKLAETETKNPDFVFFFST